MPPPRDLDMSLVGDVAGSLEHVRQFVLRRALADCDGNWAEVVRTYADQRTFLDFSARRVSSSVPRVLIEIGVRDGLDRQVTGFFDAQWDADQQRLLRIEAVVLNGIAVDVDAFVRRATPYFHLPVITVDMVSLEEAV